MFAEFQADRIGIVEAAVHGKRRKSVKSRSARPFLLSGLAMLALVATGARAVTYNVTTNADSGAGSLRNAVAQANAHPGADTITFNAGLGTISLTTGQIDITEALTINGGPASGQTYRCE
ncbi:MAG: hypothetical protein IPM02_21580 [Betaproteobacteria bacterium]|nr:hypothetical protein [Betaproteobacteria bacterium]